MFSSFFVPLGSGDSRATLDPGLDAPRFDEALKELVVRFKNTASLAFVNGKATGRHSIRVGILTADGVETSCVIEVPDTKQATVLRRKMEQLFQEHPSLAIAVASQIMLTHLPGNSKE